MTDAPSGHDEPAIAFRLAKARIQPVDYATASPEEKAALDPYRTRGEPLNIIKTLANAPEALGAFRSWGNYVVSKRNSLPRRLREIIILRVGVLCRAGYEYAQHVKIGLRAGLSMVAIDQIRTGEIDDWPAEESVLVRLADEIVTDHFVADATWAELLRHYDQRQAMDAVFTAAEYVMISIMLNSFGVQLEDDFHDDAG